MGRASRARHRDAARRARAESGERAAHLEAEVESLRAKVAPLESELSAARAEAARRRFARPGAPG